MIARPNQARRDWRSIIPSSPRFNAADCTREQLPVGLSGQQFVTASADVGTFWLPGSDAVMRPFLQRCETWERSIGALLRRLIRPGCRFLDVGAGVGYFSVLASKAAPNVRVDAVEANPQTTPLLDFNLWVNDVRATVWPLALSDERRGLPLAVADGDLGDARVGAIVANESYSVVVPAMRADDVFRRRCFDVVKIDVRGWEREVLLGMQGILAGSPDIALVAEFSPSVLRRRGVDPRHVLEAYRQMGLTCVVVRGDTLEDLPDDAVVAMCDSAGRDGSVNLLLRHR